MKTYRLVSWPDLPAEFRRTAYRRVLSELSLRHVGLTQLVEVSGLRRPEVQALLDMLDAKRLLDVNDCDDTPFEASVPAGGPLAWLKRNATASPWRG